MVVLHTCCMGIRRLCYIHAAWVFGGVLRDPRLLTGGEVLRLGQQDLDDGPHDNNQAWASCKVNRCIHTNIGTCFRSVMYSPHENTAETGVRCVADTMCRPCTPRTFPRWTQEKEHTRTRTHARTHTRIRGACRTWRLLPRHTTCTCITHARTGTYISTRRLLPERLR